MIFKKKVQEKDTKSNEEKLQEEIEAQLKESLTSASLQSASIRKEIATLEPQVEEEKIKRQKEEKHLNQLKEDLDFLRKLSQVKSDTSIISGLNDQIEEQRKEVHDHKKQSKKLKKEFKKLKQEKDASDESHQQSVNELNTTIIKLHSDRNLFEKKCNNLQLAQLAQNFSEKTIKDIENEAKEIWAKQLDLLPVHKDLPRLARQFDIIDMGGNILSTGDPDTSIESNIKKLLVNTARRLDGDKKANEITEKFDQYIEPGKDLIKALLKLLKEQVGEQSKVVGVLKAANQSIIAPVVGFVQAGLEEVLPFNSKKWKIQVLVGDNLIRVTHKRLEKAAPDSEEQYGPFTFEWTIDFILDRNVTEIKSIAVKLTSVNTEPGIKKDKEATLRDLLTSVFEGLSGSRLDSAKKGVKGKGSTNKKKKG